MIARAAGDVGVLLLVVAVVAFVLALLQAWRGAIETAVVLAIIGVLALIFS